MDHNREAHHLRTGIQFVEWAVFGLSARLGRRPALINPASTVQTGES
jgi:hypothetical protein